MMAEAFLGWLKLLQGMMFFLQKWIFFGGGVGKVDMFSETYGFLRGLKLFPLSRVSCQGVRDFSGGGRLIFFLEDVQFFGGGYILKIAFFS